MERIGYLYVGVDSVRSSMPPEVLGVLVSSYLLTVLFAIAVITMAYVMVRERSARRLGSLMASFVGMSYWLTQSILRTFFGYVGPSATMSEIGIFKDAVFAFGVLWMALALIESIRRSRK